MFKSYEIVITPVTVFLINAKLCSYVKMYCMLSFHVFVVHIADVG